MKPIVQYLCQLGRNSLMSPSLRRLTAIKLRQMRAQYGRSVAVWRYNARFFM